MFLHQNEMLPSILCKNIYRKLLHTCENELSYSWSWSFRNPGNIWFQNGPGHDFETRGQFHEQT